MEFLALKVVLVILDLLTNNLVNKFTERFNLRVCVCVWGDGGGGGGGGGGTNAPSREAGPREAGPRVAGPRG